MHVWIQGNACANGIQIEIESTLLVDWDVFARKVFADLRNIQTVYFQACYLFEALEHLQRVVFHWWFTINFN